MLTLDLNCDLGEGAGRDADLMPLVTSANIACGGHAGDEISMRAAVTLAQRHGVAIGAHPSFNDRANFGRKEWQLSPAVIYQLVIEQVTTLSRHAPVCHVKPHGALYTLAARDPDVASAIASAVAKLGGLTLYALAGSELVRAGRRQGVRVAEEVFADRTYQRDGSLTPRSQPGALIDDSTAAVAQVLRMVREGTVVAVDGTVVPIVADTVCVHGDGPHAVEFARRLRADLTTAGVSVRALGR